jgi:cytochrome c oxidase assembly protein subunit 15
VVGGITRLTHSGLSIGSWQPLVGVLPPLTDADWAAAFAQYRATPEGRLVNAGMDLAGFQHIYGWEYAHRLVARLAGLVFALPLLWFLWRRRIAGPLAWRLASILALGAAQGALGWYMVASGLVDDPHVSPLRLAAHLGLALLLIGLLAWTAWRLQRAAPARPVRGAVGAWLGVAAVFAMALTGAVVAGTRAGFAFNTFPLMNGEWIPAGSLALDPWYRNFRDNLATVQFVHRCFALVVVLVVAANLGPLFERAAHRSRRRAAAWMAAALALQLGLGIATLLSVVALPLAAAHQAGAVLLFIAALWNAYVQTQAGLPFAMNSPRPRQRERGRG